MGGWPWPSELMVPTPRLEAKARVGQGAQGRWRIKVWGSSPPRSGRGQGWGWGVGKRAAASPSGCTELGQRPRGAHLSPPGPASASEQTGLERLGTAVWPGSSPAEMGGRDGWGVFRAPQWAPGPLWAGDCSDTLLPTASRAAAVGVGGFAVSGRTSAALRGLGTVPLQGAGIHFPQSPSPLLGTGGGCGCRIRAPVASGPLQAPADVPVGSRWYPVLMCPRVSRRVPDPHRSSH